MGGRPKIRRLTIYGEELTGMSFLNNTRTCDIWGGVNFHRLIL